MKKPAYLVLLSLLCLAPISARADFTINLDAGLLTSPVSAAMQADNNSGSINGSLLLVIDLGSGNSASNSLTAGSFVSGNNTILAAGGFNTNGDGVTNTNETLTVFDVTASANPGDEIALRWFPQITLAQYDSGALTTTGEYFGTYNPAGGNPDGGSPWIVPSPGSLVSLNFYTSDSVGGGSQAPSAGYAGSRVLSPEVAPEPSTYVLLGLGVLVLFTIRRRVVRC